MKIPDGAMAVLRGLRQAGHEAFLVGGCVRDRLLGRPVNDWDIATSAEPEQVIAAFRRTIPTGLQHGTVTVVEAGEPIEVTTYRVEGGYTDGRRPDSVRFTRRIEDDLARRDFTVNAMAWDPLDDRVVDPFAGQADLAARCLRAVGTAHDRFAEDGLRAMRAVRFAAVLDFGIEPGTWAAIPQTLDTFAKVAVERIQVELTKTLRSDRAGWGLSALREAGLLGVFLPQLAELAAVDFERAVVGVDTVQGLERRLACALWDVDAEAAVRSLRYGNDVIRTVARLHALRGLDPAEPLTDAALRERVAGVGRDLLDDWLAVGAARGEPAVWTALAERIEAIGARDCPHSAKELALDGRAVMDALQIPPSRRLGDILDALLRRVWAEPALNTAEGLRAILPQVAEEVP